MDAKLFNVLDKAMFAGGADMAASAIAPSGKSGKQLLDQLCDNNWLKKTGAKYSVTEGGEQAWREQASEKRKQEWEQQQAERKQENLVAFLKVVEKRNGRTKLSSKELKTFADVLPHAKERRLIVPGDGADKYNLLAQGKELLLASLPPEEQLDCLRKAHEEINTRWRAAHQALRSKLNQVCNGTGKGENVVASLHAKVQQIRDTSQSALTELEAFPHLLRFAHELEEAAVSVQHSVVAAVGEQLAQIESLTTRVKQELQQQEKNLEAFREQCQRQFAGMAEKLEKPRTDTNGSTADGNGDIVLPEAKVWQTSQHAIQELKRKDSIVIVPELTDAVRKAIPNLSMANYHEFLKKWQREDRIIIQVCNNPTYEARASEGIESSGGLLYYVQMR